MLGVKTIRRHLVILLVASWAILGFGGIFYLIDYAKTPGDPGHPASAWPQASQIQLDSQKSTLLMFVHPQCTCSKASVAELQKLVAKAADKISTKVIFTQPKGMTGDLKGNELATMVQAIPGVALFHDASGEEAERFGVATSGHVFLFDTDGQRLYSGGITAARGHVGDNSGESSVLSLLNHEKASGQQWPVFGCSLFDTTKQIAALNFSGGQ